VTFLKGTEPNELSWSVAKLEVSDDAGVPADCKYKYLFGLVALQRELQSCGGETSSKDERYSNTDECKALLGQGSTVLCNTCRDTGAAIATIETVMMMLGIFAGITIVFRMCDQNKEDPLKHFIVTLLLTGVTIGLFVAWVLWLSTWYKKWENATRYSDVVIFWQSPGDQDPHHEHSKHTSTRWACFG